MPDTHRIRVDDGIALACVADDFTAPWRRPRDVLLLHGATGSHRRFHAWVPTLARRFRVLRLDFRGHGASELPAADSRLDMPRLVEDVRQALDALGVASVDIVGASAGGYVAQHMALAHPGRVRSLLLFGSSAGLKNSGTAAWAARIAAEGLRAFLATTIDARFDRARTDPRLIEWFLDDCARTDPAFGARFIALMSSLEWSERLPEIGCPVLLARPAAETIGGADPYAVMMQRLRDLDVLTYEGGRHNFFDAEPERCAADALAFLERRFPDTEHS